MRFKHGQYVPVSGNGMQLLFHGYSTLYAVMPAPKRQITSHRRMADAATLDPMRRRLLIALAVLVVLAAGLGAAYVIHRMHEDRNIRGSSTQEFVTTKSPTVKRLSLAVPWPMFGLTATRTRSVALALAPPFRKLWTYHAGSLVEFPPSIGYGRMYVSTNSGKFAAVNLKTGKTAWKYLAHRCVAASPAIGPQHHGSVFAVFLNRPPCNAQTGGHGTNGAVIDFGVGFGKIRWTKIIGPSETSPLLLGDRLYVGDWNGNVWAIDARNGKTIWRFHTGGPVKGGVAYAGGKLYVGSYDGHVYCLVARRQEDLEGRRRAAAVRALAVLFDACGRVRPGLHRLDRREGVLVRRDHRQAALVAQHRRLRLRVARGLRATSSLPARSSKRFFALRRGHRRREVELHRERPDRRLGHGRRRSSSTSPRSSGGRTRLNVTRGEFVWTYPGRQVLAGGGRPRTDCSWSASEVYGMVPR